MTAMIPIRCFSCGMRIGDRYLAYVNEVLKRSAYVMHRSDADAMTPVYFSSDTETPSIHGQVLNDLGITNLCCRGICLSHVYSAGDHVQVPNVAESVIPPPEPPMFEITK